MSKEKWICYFTCPVCKELNYIKNWVIEDGNDLTIKFETGENSKIIFRCKCGKEFEIGLMKMPKE